MHHAIIQTPDGKFTASFSENGLAQLDFPGQSSAFKESNALPEKVQDWVHLTKESLLSALQGRQPEALPPLDLHAGTTFQQSVWEALICIPSGGTQTYGDIACALRRPGAARAVGSACGANPVPVLVPCHRVLACQGRLGGFSGGLDWKRKLLQRERSGLL
jgi:methylated-DNA-[protein]-cysteine S-methyltransferase